MEKRKIFVFRISYHRKCRVTLTYVFVDDRILEALENELGSLFKVVRPDSPLDEWTYE